MSPPDIKIRVLLIAPSMDILGGQSVQAVRLLERLRQEPLLEMRFLPINPRLPGPLRFLQQIKFVRTLATFVLYNSKLFWDVRRVDVVHVFTAGLWSYTLWTIPALIAARLFRKKIVVNYRDGRAEQHLREFRSAAPTLRMATVIVSPSPFLVDVFARYGIRAKSIPNVMDFSRFPYRQRSKLRPVFMTNRSLEPLYNVACLLRAFRLVQDRYPEASLTIANDGPLRAELENHARELQLRNTRFIGPVAHAQVPALYDSADIYLTSPNVDCMPGSLLECFASGLPVIATKAGGIPYLAAEERTALLVDLDDHQAVAERAFRLLENEGLVERLTTAAREEAQQYDWSVVHEQWLAQYRELAGI